jgi:tagaturonate reductase
MILSGFTLKNINSAEIQTPKQEIFDLPEKVLQFGTGVLLRALPDYFIDKANKKGIFNGRVVVVKSTDGGDSVSFEKQDGLYSICIRGIENGNTIEENIVCAAISRVLSAKTEWNRVLECAHVPSFKIIISNTTEVGIELVNEDITSLPPASYPGKLLAFLHERYKAFNGSTDSGLLIIPTELIVDNGKKLESIVIELAHLNGLDNAFMDWLENCNTFCSSLVDRIVPGKPEATIKKELQKQLGYEDELMTMCESYRLWAIEGDKKVAEVLSFAKADKGVVIAKDIELFRELKLRLLNGTHTLASGIAALSGIRTVKNAMDDQLMSEYISNLMRKEIALAIPYKTDPAEADDFAVKVLDRFRNAGIEHQWLSITAQYTSKMQMRIVPVLLEFYRKHRSVPPHIALGFAAYILFTSNGNEKDDRSDYLTEKLKHNSIACFAKIVLQDKLLWGQDLSALPGFAEAVQEKLQEIREQGIVAVLKDIQKIPA